MFGLTAKWQIMLAEYLIVITVVFGAAWWVYDKGYSQCEQDKAVAQAKADKAQQDKYNLVAQQYEDLKNTRQQNVNTITHEITRITEKPIYNVSCIDDSGRMLINDALAGRKYSGSTSGSMPTVTTP